MSNSNTALGAFAQCLNANAPVILWGPPGIGKTARINQIAQRLGWPIETVLASIRQPDDFAGLPWIRDNGVVMVPPDWGRRLQAIKGPSILFFDEISSTAAATQSALLRVVLERVVGDVQLPETVRILAAANPPDQAAGGWDLAAPLANRFAHLVWPTPTAQEWADWLAKQQSVHPKAVGVLASLIVRRPELLFDMPENETKAGQAWASPRSWFQAGRLIGDLSLPSAVEESLVRGCVGEAASLEFMSWRSDGAELPDPEALLANPQSWSVPEERTDLIFATLHSVVAAALGDLTPPRWKAVWSVLERALPVAADAVLSAGMPLSVERRAMSARSAQGQAKIAREYPAPIWFAQGGDTIRELREAM